MTTPSKSKASNVIDLFTGQSYQPKNYQKIIRLSPEYDNLEMLYTNDANPNKLYSLKILCWALQENGDVIGLVPWLNDITNCQDLNDPLRGRWVGYFDPGIDEIFYDAPKHKRVELEYAADFYQFECESEDDIIQEIPDNIGTHAVFTQDNFSTFVLDAVFSWRLHYDGSISAMMIDQQKVVHTPVLPGDDCLYPAQTHAEFKYFFQYGIANKIKSQDAKAIDTIHSLIDLDLLR